MSHTKSGYMILMDGKTGNPIALTKDGNEVLSLRGMTQQEAFATCEKWIKKNKPVTCFRSN